MSPRHNVLMILCLTWIISLMDRMAVSVTLPYIADEYRLTPFASGLVMSLFYAGYAIMHVPGGMLADRFGARKVASIAIVWWSIFTAVTGAAFSFTQLLVARFLFGLSEGVVPACTFKTVAIWFPKRERGTATAVMLASAFLGSALAPLLLVHVLAHAQWRTVFYCLSLPTLALALLFWTVVRDVPRIGGSGVDRRLTDVPGTDVQADNAADNNGIAGPRIRMIDVVRQPNILKYFLILIFYDFTYVGYTSWLPTYLVKARGFSMAGMGIAASLPFFGSMAATLVGGWLADRGPRKGRNWYIAGSLMLAAALLYLIQTASSIPVLLICQTLAGMTMGFFVAMFWAMPLTAIPKEVMGVTGGLLSMATQIAAFLAPMIIGYLVSLEGGGFTLTFAFLIGGLLAAAALVFTLRDVPAAQQVLAVPT